MFDVSPFFSRFDLTPVNTSDVSGMDRIIFRLTFITCILDEVRIREPPGSPFATLLTSVAGLVFDRPTEARSDTRNDPRRGSKPRVSDCHARNLSLFELVVRDGEESLGLGPGIQETPR